MNGRRVVLVASLVGLLSACLVVPGRHGPEVIAVPPLPQIVDLLDDAFYFQSGYWYYYQGDRWSYGHSQNGPWAELPRDRYPREVRRGRGRGGGRGDEDEDEEGRGGRGRDRD